MWHTNIPTICTGNNWTCTTPGHTCYMKTSLLSSRMLKTMETWNLQTQKYSLMLKSLSLKLSDHHVMIHWTYSPADFDHPSSPGSHRRHGSYYSWPTLWWLSPGLAAGSPPGQVRCGLFGRAAVLPGPPALSGYSCWLWTQSAPPAQPCAQLWSDSLSETPAGANIFSLRLCTSHGSF